MSDELVDHDGVLVRLGLMVQEVQEPDFAVEKRTLIDRSDWPAGPWDEEPQNREEWKAHGFPCMISRSGNSGAWCGYVAVPPGHPAYGAAYDRVDVEVHGGLTYAAKCQDHICHKAQPGETDDVWWLGFDCAHYLDLCPATLGLYRRLGLPADPAGRGELQEHYRDAHYAKRWTNRLAQQLADLSTLKIQEPELF